MIDLIRDGIHVCRKARTCDQCLRLIQVGQRYRKQVYSDGGLQTYCAHEDCDAAATEYMKLADYHWTDDPAILSEVVCSEDAPWLREKFPAVAERLNF